MTTEHDSHTRIVLSWLREDLHENAERVLLLALNDVDATPQRRSWWPAWRFDLMNTFAKLAAAGVAVLLVAVIGYQFLPGTGAGGGGQPAVSPTPSPALLASGSFRFPPRDAAVALDAAGEGADVTGTMTVSSDTMSFTVDLECSLTAEDGRILIGGNTTESTFADTPTGTRTAIVLKPGSPVRALFVWQGTDLARAASCTAFLEDMSPDTTGPVPIDGTVQFGP